MRSLSLIALSALLASAVAPAQPAAAAKKDGQKMICKSQAGTGSRFGTRTCHTKAEWDAIREEAGRSYDDMRTRYMNTCTETPQGETVCH